MFLGGSRDMHCWNKWHTFFPFRVVAFGKTLALLLFFPLAATEEGDEVTFKVWLAGASAEASAAASAAASAEAFSSITCCSASTDERVPGCHSKTATCI